MEVNNIRNVSSIPLFLFYKKRIMVKALVKCCKQPGHYSVKKKKKANLRNGDLGCVCGGVRAVR